MRFGIKNIMLANHYPMESGEKFEQKKNVVRSLCAEHGRNSTCGRAAEIDERLFECCSLVFHANK